MLAVQREHELDVIYFFLVADYGLNDKNVPITSLKFQRLIKTLGDYAQVGVHPSYASNTDKSKLRLEMNRLQSVLHQDMRKSRQHFLKLHFPDTYRDLLDAGITDDYTVGYASELGFRAGCCTPYRWYDLQREAETKLRIHPFSAMEVTLRFYRNVPAEQAIDHIKPIVDAVKAVDGTFMSLWHNDSLSDTKQWAGWKGLYEEMVQYAKP